MVMCNLEASLTSDSTFDQSVDRLVNISYLAATIALEVVVWFSVTVKMGGS